MILRKELKLRRLLVLAALLGLLAACAVAYATPSYTGATGGIALPDAKTTPMGNLDLALDFQNQKLGDAEEATTVRASFGLSTNAEVGVKYAWQQGIDNPDLDNWGISAKYVLPMKLIDLDVAVGGNYAKYSDLDTKQVQLYAVGGTNVWQSYENDRSVDVNIGINWTKFETVGGDINRLRMFGVADYRFRDTLHLIGELQTKSKLDSEALSSLALRYAMDENLSLQFGVTNAFRGVAGANVHNWFLGANYRFSSFSEK